VSGRRLARLLAVAHACRSFLDDVDRITARGYEVSDDDVIRARLRTVGVQEHHFVFDEGRAAGTEWVLYDVGGHRSARATWAPYFDTVDAIIFLAYGLPRRLCRTTLTGWVAPQPDLVL
jgi:hypothetical protein